MIVLDTNVVSEVMRPQPDAQVIAYLDTLAPDEVAVTAVTVAEVRYGIRRLDAGRRRSELHKAAETLFADVFDGRALAFDGPASNYYADITATREAAGQPISVFDAMIAAICCSKGASLATRNIKDFTGLGVPLSDPWA